MGSAGRSEGSDEAEQLGGQWRRASEAKVSNMCTTIYELTQPTKAGARESTRADLIEERPQFPQRPTDVATGALRSGH